MGFIHKEVSPNRIFLNSDNPRHEPIEEQPAIIEYLCTQEQAVDLAIDIAEQGMSPIDLLAVTEMSGGGRSSNYLVLEGNRRVCAIKMLHDTDNAPSKYRGRIEAAIKKFQFSMPKKVLVTIFDDAEEARPWMLRLHGGEQSGIGRKRWRADQLERFRGDNGRYPVALALLDLAEELNLLTKKQREGQITTLGRYTVNASMKEVLGTSLVDGEPQTDRTDDDIKLMLKVICDDLMARKITSRHNKKEITPYARGLEAASGASNERIASHPLAEVGDDERKSSSGKGKGGKNRRRKRPAHKPTKIVPSRDLQDALDQMNSKLRILYDSICDVSAVDHPMLLHVGGWAFLDSLAAACGKPENGKFAAHFNKGRMGQLQFTRKQSNDMYDALERVSRGGNVTKHSPAGGAFSGEQLINDFELVTPLLIAELNSKKLP